MPRISGFRRQPPVPRHCPNRVGRGAIVQFRSDGRGAVSVRKHGSDLGRLGVGATGRQRAGGRHVQRSGTWVRTLCGLFRNKYPILPQCSIVTNALRCRGSVTSAAPDFSFGLRAQNACQKIKSADEGGAGVPNGPFGPLRIPPPGRITIARTLIWLFAHFTSPPVDNPVWRGFIEPRPAAYNVRPMGWPILSGHSCMRFNTAPVAVTTA